MISSVRAAFNQSFTPEKYQSYLKDMDDAHPGAIEFRVAETPVFVPKAFTRQMLETCESIVDFIINPAFIKLTERSIPDNVTISGENNQPQFIAFDFGICENANGDLEPQLIEMQGFPTIFAYQVLQDEMLRKNFDIPAGFDCYLEGYNRTSYIHLLKEIIISDAAPEQVILLELFPHKQKTKIDFYCTEDYIGVKPVCLTELSREGNKLYYHPDGKKLEIRRIYNRIIFDELQQQTEEVRQKADLLLGELDVEWIPHPNWFYRVSKFTLPFIRHPFVPPTFFLNEIQQLPVDLHNYVLKPLFSFAGQGVVIDLTMQEIENVKDPENWILQRKVKYADIIQTPDVAAKAEIRLFYFWKDGTARPVATNNLARLSKGKMIGVRYNQEKSWVGGTICYFEK